MTKLKVFTVTALAVMCVATAGTSVTQRKAKSGPVMEIEPKDHDFGGVQQAQKRVHKFTVTNIGTEDLEIRRIST